MNEPLRDLLKKLLRQNIIGGRHVPKRKIVVSTVKYLSKHEQKEFYQEYKELFNENILFRNKKRTGKNFDWHISINPRRVNDVENLVKGGNYERI